MIDLTPLDVRKKIGDFRRMLRGYDPGEVDTFLKLVEDRLEALVMENLALTEKAQRLAAQLEALEGREKAVQEALVTAQKLREEVQEQSRREAESLRDQAVRETESLREQVERESESLRGEAHREASSLRDEAIREAASVRDRARREAELIWKEATGEIEARILEAEGLIKERQRALEELERNRRKFLKGFRSLLEREMDSVEVEEARQPLEDVPLELNLRGWSREEEAGSAEATAAEDGSGGGPEDTEGLEAYEPVIELDASEGEAGRGAQATGGWGAMPGDEPPEGEFSDIVPVGVFDSSLAGETPPGAGEGPDVAPGGGAEDSNPQEGPDVQDGDAVFGQTVDHLLDPESGEDGSAGPEPLWLSSLLKQEEEGRGKGLVAKWTGAPEEGEGEKEEEEEEEKTKEEENEEVEKEEKEKEKEIE